MARSTEDLARELETRSRRPLGRRESDYDVIFEVVEWFATLNSEEKNRVREAMGDLVSRAPQDILVRELNIIREIRALPAAAPLEQLARSLGNGPWRDDILITLQELDCGTAADLCRQRLRELQDSGPPFDPEILTRIEQFWVRMIFLDPEEAIRLQATQLAASAREFKSHPGSLTPYVDSYLSAAPGRLVDLLAAVATIDPQAALLVRDALAVDMESSLDYLEKKHGPQVRSLCASIKTWYP